MIFSDFYKGPRSPLAKLRPHLHLAPPQNNTQPPPVVLSPSTMDATAPEWTREEYSDLLSKDKTKVKEAVKRYLADQVRTDWDFTWPPSPEPANIDEIVKPLSPPASERSGVADHEGADEKPDVKGLDGANDVPDEVDDDAGYQADDGDEDDDVRDAPHVDDGASIYSFMSEDPLHYKTLEEWDSDAPNDEFSPLEEVSPERLAHEQNMTEAERQAEKRRALRQEMEWNEGLACFEARRNAWTEARTVRLRRKPGVVSPVSPTRSPRRFFFRRSMSSTPSTPSQSVPPVSAISVSLSEVTPEVDESQRSPDRDSTSNISQESGVSSYPVATIVPLASPILPPGNTLRASIHPSHYLQLYDKLILSSLTPSCPVNLSDMIRACVAGWKRDGEWPPRPTIPLEPTFAPVMATKKKRASFVGQNDSGFAGRRMSFTGLLSRDKDGESRNGKGVRQSIQRALGIHPSLPHDAPVTVEKAQ
ncbi:unnamed protein product [Clonostachys rosea f. rosea IK726]|jgi:hypothetical protein|uniref:Gag1-like clamp domain-containing protein n=2 Tax=Bionectria ochroleuca TaxID=29856 RepID=A0A0B7JU84_BIOOC|nr:unnamed protein product [Clonostachys rosea f. rosea IK726]